MSSSKKRSRSEPAEEGRAECPFSVVYVSPGDKGPSKKGNKRRKQSEPAEDTAAKLQNSPFAPTGKFKNDETLDVHYQVEPRDEWLNMTRYNSFVLNQAKYFSEGFIYVANDSTVAPKDAARDAPSNAQRRPQEGWVARILEIRAKDEHHVYARVYWMYWPEEIPSGTKDNGKAVVGRQSYHGFNELIASNHMDVINVVSVTQEAKVKQWVEENDDEIQDALYWRQAIDVRSMQLSSIQRTCRCNQPANPDKILVACSATDSCGKWLHQECLKHDALMRTYEALGADRPYHKKATATSETNGNENDGKVDKATGRPLSPPDNAAEVKQTIDAKVKQETPESSTPRPAAGSITATGTRSSSQTRKGKGGRGKGKKRDANERPYEGLFEAELRVAESPSVVEIRDLRENVTGGDKVWTEPLSCLLCGVTIS